MPRRAARSRPSSVVSQTVWPSARACRIVAAGSRTTWPVSVRAGTRARGSVGPTSGFGGSGLPRPRVLPCGREESDGLGAGEDGDQLVGGRGVVRWPVGPRRRGIGAGADPGDEAREVDRGHVGRTVPERRVGGHDPPGRVERDQRCPGPAVVLRVRGQDPGAVTGRGLPEHAGQRAGLDEQVDRPHGHQVLPRRDRHRGQRRPGERVAERDGGAAPLVQRGAPVLGAADARGTPPHEGGSDGVGPRGRLGPPGGGQEPGVAGAAPRRPGTAGRDEAAPAVGDRGEAVPVPGGERGGEAPELGEERRVRRAVDPVVLGGAGRHTSGVDPVDVTTSVPGRRDAERDPLGVLLPGGEPFPGRVGGGERPRPRRPPAHRRSTSDTVP